MGNKPHLVIVTGETSGDNLASSLITDLLKKTPDINISGIFGPKLRLLSKHQIAPMESLQVMGFSGVILSLKRILSILKKIKYHILRTKPQAVLLVDYADFNMHLAKQLRKKGYQGKIIQYVCPSFWAWRKNRLQTLKSNYDLILAIYPFELAYFKDNTTAIYQKHPLLTIKNTHNKPLPATCPNKKIVAVFPGSRPAEIRSNLKLQLLSLQNNTEFQPVISVANNKLMPQIKAICKQINSNALLYTKEYNNNLMKHAYFALATSGTITLELALNETPTIVTYRLSAFDTFCAKFIFKISMPYYCIVNILMKKEIFIEAIDQQFTLPYLQSATQKLSCSNFRATIKDSLKNLSSVLNQQEIPDQGIKKILSFLT